MGASECRSCNRPRRMEFTERVEMEPDSSQAASPQNHVAFGRMCFLRDAVGISPRFVASGLVCGENVICIFGTKPG